MRSDISIIDRLNWPPPWGQNPAAGVSVSGFICPSTPQRTIDYSSYFVSSLGLPNAGPCILGATDYAAIRGIRNNFRNFCHPAMPATPRPTETGVLGVPKSPTGMGERDSRGLVLGKIQLTDIKDGLSNSIVFPEASGRHQVYLQGAKKRMPNAPGQAGWALNASFLDYNSAIIVGGFSSDGTILDGGCNFVNVTNSRGVPGQLYSFHPGTVGSLRVDGSVHFVSETISAAAMVALITRSGRDRIIE
jgi:hypothetical protein